MRHSQGLLITAYENIDYLIELLKIYNKYFRCYVHIDKKCKINENQWNELKHLDRVVVISEYKINWGSYKHILAILKLLKMACEDSCGYIHIISANTLPVRNPEKIIQFYEQNIEYIFMETLNRSMLNPKEAFEAFEYRCKAYFFDDIINVKPSWGGIKLRQLIQTMERFFADLQIKLNIRQNVQFDYKGYVYCHFPLDAAREVLFYINNNETYIKKLKRCYVGEEFFFQNIFMNTKWKDKVVNDCRIFDIWGKDRGYPAFLCKSDIMNILVR